MNNNMKQKKKKEMGWKRRAAFRWTFRPLSFVHHVGGHQSVNADYHIKFNDSKTHSHLGRATTFQVYRVGSLLFFFSRSTKRYKLHSITFLECRLIKTTRLSLYSLRFVLVFFFVHRSPVCLRA